MIRSATANRRSLAAATILLVVTLAARARAGPTGGDAALAEALFDEARRLMQVGRYESACPKLAESQRLDPGGGTLLNLALCHEAEGKTATAWAELKEALGMARKDGRVDRERLAEEHIVKLESHLSRLTVRVGAGADAPGLVVTRDGAPLARAGWGLAVPVDPGQHELAATAGLLNWHSTVSLRDGEQRVVDVPAWQAPAPTSSSPADAPRPAVESSGSRTAGFVVLGAGLASVAAGAYFGISALDKRKRSNDVCNTLACPPEHAAAVSLNDDARHAAALANITLGLGAIASGLGAYLIFSSPTATASSAFLPTIAPQRSGAVISWSHAW